MKNKRLIILLSIFSFIILLVVLSSTVFTVHSSSISVEWHIRSSPLDNMKNQGQAIIDTINDRENIVFYDKNKATNTLEEKFPYIKVLKIEKKFPNKIIVHATERREQYCIKVDDEYFALDESGKVLNVYSKEDFDRLGEQANRKPILVDIVGLTVEASTMQTGKTAQIPRVVTILQNVSKALNNSGYTETWQIINNIASINIEFGYKSQLIVHTNRNGMSISVDDINKDLASKIKFGLGLLSTREFASEANKVLNVGYDSEGRLVGTIPEENTP